MQNKIRLLIHGGAGTINVTEKNKEFIANNLQELKQIITKNYQALLSGAFALDVAEQAVIALENYEGFNAAHGAVLNNDGRAELDAAIMDGKDRAAGAVAAVQRIKNPISGARAVMEYSQHVMLAGSNADVFCEQRRIEIVDPKYFLTKIREQQLQNAQQEGHAQNIDSLGTVGAVVCDIYGNLAAATSTGGKANKIPGRVGDSPIIGAGTWADNNTCAVSGTGDGEYFIRCTFAHEIVALLEYKNLDLKSACEQALKQVAALGGEGGCIAIDKHGNVAMTFNTMGMYRGWVDNQGVACSAV